MLSRDVIERHQPWLYLAAVLAGLGAGRIAPAHAAMLVPLLWPLLALLLYATFIQVPLSRLPEAFRDARFITAALLGNFVVLPVLVWAVLWLLPQAPAIRLGLLLVLLVPCTDWFITFSHLAGGDPRRAIPITPVLLLAQMGLLPLFLWAFMGAEFVQVASAGRMAMVFAIVVALPLAAALLTGRWAAKRAGREVVVERLGLLPVPLLAAVLALVAATQVEAVADALPRMGPALLACIVFLVGAVACGWVVGRLFTLPVAQARTLLFSLSTRNSFVVLPFALALPAGWELAAIAIVLQSLVELFGMLALLWAVPRMLLPAR